jgi:glycerol uptake facilitator protein
VGEFIGTFILVFFGCGAVAVSILFQSYSGLFQIAMIWGIAVSLAIYASRGLSCAHLNPAVSIAFVLAGRMSCRKIPVYLGAQFLAAFLAAAMIYALFGHVIVGQEAAQQIVRGTPESIRFARMFGEYFYQPAGNALHVPYGVAFLAEAFGTFLLMTFIFALTEGCNVGRPHEQLAPVFIGAAVAIIICIIAPLTQAGLNPARDFGPRLFAYFAGWGKASIPGPDNGFLGVYILGPIIGAVAATAFFKGLFQPQSQNGTDDKVNCC